MFSDSLPGNNSPFPPVDSPWATAPESLPLARLSGAGH